MNFKEVLKTYAPKEKTVSLTSVSPMERQSKWITRLQIGFLASFVGTIGGAMYLKEQQEETAKKTLNAMLETLDETEEKVPTSSFSSAEMGLIIERSQEFTIDKASKMKLLGILLQLENAGEIKNKNTARVMLDSLAPINSTGFAPAHYELGIAMSSAVMKQLEEDPATEVPVQTWVTIEHHLSIGLSADQAKNNSEAVKKIVNNIRSQLIKHYVSTDEVHNAKYYITSLIESEPAVAPTLLYELHKIDKTEFDKIIEEVALQELAKNIKENRNKPEYYQIRSEVLVQLNKFKAARNSHEQSPIGESLYNYDKDHDQDAVIEAQTNYYNFLMSHTDKFDPNEHIAFVLRSNKITDTQKATVLRELCNTYLPENVQPIWEVIIDSYVVAKQPHVGNERLEIILKKDPSLTEHAVGILSIFGIKSLEDSVAETALKKVEQDVTKNPKDASLILYKAKILTLTDKWEDAHDMLETAIFYNTQIFSSKEEKEQYSKAIAASIPEFFDYLIRTANENRSTQLIHRTKLLDSVQKKCLLLTVGTIHGNGDVQMYMQTCKEVLQDKKIPSSVKAGLLNNFAWDMFSKIINEKNVSKKAALSHLRNALEIAKRADALAPNSPEIQDTVMQIEDALAQLTTSTSL